MRCRILLIVAALSLGMFAPARGQDAKLDVLAAQRSKVASEMDRLKKSVSDAPKDQTETIEKTIATLRGLDSLYAQTEVWTKEIHRLEAEVASEKRNLEALDDFIPDEPKPYSLLLVDQLKDQLLNEEERERALKAKAESAEQILKAARQNLDKVGAAASKSTSHDGKQVSPMSSGEYSAASLPVLTARAEVASNQANERVCDLRLELSRLREKQLKQKIDVFSKDLAFTQVDLSNALEKLSTAESQLRRRLVEANARFQDLRQEMSPVSAEKSAAPSSNSIHDKQLRDTADVYQTEVMILNQQIEDVEALQQIWKHRFELKDKHVDRSRLLTWRDEVDAFIKRLKDEKESIEEQRESAAAAVVTLERATDGKDATTWEDEQLDRLRALLDLTAASLTDVKSGQRVVDRYREELSSQIKKSTGLLEQVRKSLYSLAGWEVAGSDDETITIGKLALLVVILVVGVIMALYVSKWIGRRVLTRFGISRGKKAAIRTIVFYALCLTSGVIAFRVLNVPLAAFAFVGGAAAIAVGFGSQDIMNNFMSGLILLTEQPIRVGDVIELGGVEAVVLHIGMRSTRLRTQFNHEVIVPNKTLLDEQVTNFTLSNDVVRRVVSVTVERSVPIQEAKKKILRVARRQRLVLKTPRPIVTVKEIDNYYGTTTFEVYFAMHLNSFMECTVVQGRIREKIGELFPPVDSTTSTTANASDANEADPDESSAADEMEANSVFNVNESRIIKELRKLRKRQA